jgi:hypothetical protein
MDTDGRTRRIPMGKKISKLRKLTPDQSDLQPEAVRLGSATSGLPQPLQSAVDATFRWGVPRSLRDELAVAIFTCGCSDLSDAPTGHFRPSAESSSVPSSVEWRTLARARADEVTAKARSHPLLGLWLKPQGKPGPAWRGLRDSLRRAIETFAGLPRRQRHGPSPEPCSCDWQWLFPPEPGGERDHHSRPAFEEPMQRALWSWIRHGGVSPAVPSPAESLSKRQIGKRITALRDTILGDCSGGTLRIRHSGLLQALAESFVPGSPRRMELVVAHSLERPDGTRISSKDLPMNAIEPLLAGKKEQKLDPIADAIQRCRIRSKLGLTHG